MGSSAVVVEIDSSIEFIAARAAVFLTAAVQQGDVLYKSKP